MARSRRASSAATDTPAAASHSLAGLPPSSISNRPNLVKKSSRLAIFLKHLKSPSNSDGEDNDDDGGHSDSDLDFGCTGLKAFDELDEISDGELHISLDGTAHSSPHHPPGSLATRSASITVSELLELLGYLDLVLSVHAQVCLIGGNETHLCMYGQC